MINPFHFPPGSVVAPTLKGGWGWSRAGIVDSQLTLPSLPGLRLDMNPAIGTFQDTGGSTPATIGDPVRRINNQGTEGSNLASPDDSSRPVLATNGGKNWLQFNGSKWLNYTWATTLNTPCTFFTVIQPDTLNGDYWAHVATTPAASGLLSVTSPERVTVFQTGASNSLQRVIANRPVVVAVTFSASGNNTLEVNGNPLIDVGGGNVASYTNWWYGGAPSFSSNGWRGLIGRCLGYDTVPTLANRRAVARYLAQQYGFLRSKVVVFDGNSWTFGQGASTGNSYPQQAMATIGTDWDWMTYGISGQTTPGAASNFATTGSQIGGYEYSKKVYVALEVRNHLVIGGGVDATTAYNAYVSWCQAARTAGFKVVAVTPFVTNGGTEPVGYSTANAAVCALIRANWATFADAFADVGADSRLSDPNNATYFNADKIHLTDVGYGVVASTVAPAVLSL